MGFILSCTQSFANPYVNDKQAVLEAVSEYLPDVTTLEHVQHLEACSHSVLKNLSQQKCLGILQSALKAIRDISVSEVTWSYGSKALEQFQNWLGIPAHFHCLGQQAAAYMLIGKLEIYPPKYTKMRLHNVF